MRPRFAPGPRGLPIVGSLFGFGRDQLAFLKGAASYGDIVSFRAGPMRIHLVASAELVREVLIERAGEFVQHPMTRAIFGRVLGNGILVSDGDFHRRQRRLMQPAFAARRIEGYAGTMVHETSIIARAWTPGATLDLGEEMLRIAARITSVTLFGTEAIDRAPVGQALAVLQHEASKLFRSVWIPPAWLPTPQNVRLRRATRQMEVVVLDEIARRRAEADRAGSEDARGDLLSMLLRATDEEEGTGAMTDQQLRDEAITIFLPGIETAANGLTWLFYAVAQHPEVDAAVLAEVTRVLGDRAATKDDVPSLVYTERVVREALRMFAPIWSYARSPKEPVTIGGYDVLPGDLVLVSPAVLHASARYFARPDVFDPDRFREPSHPRFSYLPFGAGPHVCIGERFAMQELTLVLATIARSWKVALVPGQHVETEALVSLRPKRPIQVTVTPRA